MRASAVEISAGWFMWDGGRVRVAVATQTMLSLIRARTLAGRGGDYEGQGMDYWPTIRP